MTLYCKLHNNTLFWGNTSVTFQAYLGTIKSFNKSPILTKSQIQSWLSDRKRLTLQVSGGHLLDTNAELFET